MMLATTATAIMGMSTNPSAPIKLGVNGFGRIGRQVVRIAMDREAFVLKHINGARAPEYLKYLLEYDTVHGRYKGTVAHTADSMTIDGNDIKVFNEMDPANIAWGSVGAEYVIESTGVFLSVDKASAHFKGGAKKVVVSAPSPDAPMFVCGVNLEKYDSSMDVVSNASCTSVGRLIA